MGLKPIASIEVGRVALSAAGSTGSVGGSPGSRAIARIFVMLGNYTSGAREKGQDLDPPIEAVRPVVPGQFATGQAPGSRLRTEPEAGKRGRTRGSILSRGEGCFERRRWWGLACLHLRSGPISPRRPPVRWFLRR